LPVHPFRRTANVITLYTCVISFRPLRPFHLVRIVARRLKITTHYFVTFSGHIIVTCVYKVLRCL
jgi:hypothetical protein